MEIIVIGKSDDCDVVIKNDTISRHHAQLAIYEDHIDVIDLGSTNGTYVNGAKISEAHTLIKGDVLVFGGDLFEWEIYEVKIQKITPNVVSENLTHSKKTNSKTIAFVVLGLIILLGAGYLILNPSILNSNSDEDAEQIDPVVEPGSVEYDFTCLEEEEDNGSNEIIGILSDVEGQIFDKFGEEVTIQEETDFGLELLKEMQTKDQGSSYIKIRNILDKLVKALPGKTEYRYEIHLVDEDVINAFTCGGQIFVYQGIIDFCENDDELAAIIAHEIAHNELGHIKRKLSQIKTSNALMGEGIGEITAMMYMTATMSFGQKLETHCDLYGIDLAFKAHYNACDVVNVWKRMDDNEFNVAESMMSSHPFSSQRANCCQNHINLHHPNSCKK